MRKRRSRKKQSRLDGFDEDLCQNYRRLGSGTEFDWKVTTSHAVDKKVWLLLDASVATLSDLSPDRFVIDGLLGDSHE